jgi:hypothetical protein
VSTSARVVAFVPAREGGLGWLTEGYDRRSLWALLSLVSVGAAVGYRWSDLVDVNGGMDWLLTGTWIWMAALLTWGVSLRRDLIMLAVGFVGGGVIEWWGTNTQLWTYFTAERPPLWILPAWPIATLAIDRMARMFDRVLDRRPVSDVALFVAYWLMVPTFVVTMFAFARHTVHILATQVVFLLMLGVTLTGKRPRRDVTLFVAGSLLGVFLEYWGTSRECWTYYTREVPPVVACVAHGFAALAFARGADAIERALNGSRRTLLRTASHPAFRDPPVRSAGRL